MLVSKYQIGVLCRLGHFEWVELDVELKCIFDPERFASLSPVLRRF